MATDLYKDWIAKAYNIDRDSITSDIRARAKTVLFGLIYGTASIAVALNITDPIDAQATFEDRAIKLLKVARSYILGECKMKDQEANVIKVSSTSKPSAVAGAIAGMIRQHVEDVKVRAIGIGAVAKAVYSLALASKYLSKDDEPKIFWIRLESIELQSDSDDANSKILTGYEFLIIVDVPETA